MKPKLVKSLSPKTLIVLVAIIPTILTTLGLVTLVSYELRRSGERNLITVQETLLEAKRQALKHAMASAITALDPLYQGAAVDDLDARQTAKTIVRRLNQQGEANFFIYPYQPIYSGSFFKPQLKNVHSPDNDLVSDDWTMGVMLERAKLGDGYTLFSRPSLSAGAPKKQLSYTVDLDKWQWMLGVTLPLHAVDAETQRVEQQIVTNIWQMLGITLSVALMAVGLMIMAARWLGKFFAVPLTSLEADSVAGKGTGLNNYGFTECLEKPMANCLGTSMDPGQLSVVQQPKATDARQAARQINELIGQSVAKVEQSSRLVTESGATLQVVLAAVKQVNDVVTELAANDTTQTQAVQQTMQAMAKISQMTEQHTDLINNTATTSFALEDQALTLRQMMGLFALDQEEFAEPVADMRQHGLYSSLSMETVADRS